MEQYRFEETQAFYLLPEKIKTHFRQLVINEVNKNKGKNRESELEYITSDGLYNEYIIMWSINDRKIKIDISPLFKDRMRLHL